MQNNTMAEKSLKEDVIWWQALNPAIYLISVLPAIGVVLITDEPLWFTGLIAATLAVVLLQHAINLFNDVSDWRLGADVNKSDSWVRLYNGNTQVINRYAIISLLLGGALGLLVLALSDKFWILIFATPLVLLGYMYNAGSRPLSYTSLGEWVTGLCYGPGVFGGLYLVTNDAIPVSAILGMLSFACLAMSLLLSHQPPQIDDDRAAGKHSFAVRYGKEVTITTSRYLFLFALISFAAALWLMGNIVMSMAFSLMTIVALIVCYQKVINPKLLLLSASTVFVVPFLFIFFIPGH